MKLELTLPEEKEQTEKQRKAYCGSIFAVFPVIEKDIRTKMYEELIKTYSIGVGTAKTKEERDFEIIRGNGIMEGMAILLETWSQANVEHQSPPDKE